MNERSDDTTKRDEGALPEPDDAAARDGKRRPGGYYYDDASGYETYDPSKAEQEEEDAGIDSTDAD